MEEEKRNLQVMSMADAAKIFPPADVARALKVTAAGGVVLCYAV